MVYLHLGHQSEINSVEFLIEDYFIKFMKPEWFENELIQRAIRDIDGNTTYYGKYRWESPVLGVIGAEQLSGGVKTLITACYRNDLILPIHRMGDNCAEPIEYLSKEFDMHFSMCSYIFPFTKTQRVFVTNWNREASGYNILREIIEEGDYELTEQSIFIKANKSNI